MPVTTSQVFVVRSRASASALIRSVTGRPEQHEFVVAIDRRARHVRDVGHDRVHRHVPDERDLYAADDRAGAVGERAATSRRRIRAGASRSCSVAWSGTSARS